MRVVLPVVRPGVFTAALFTFLFAYNEFLYCLILTGNNVWDNYTGLWLLGIVASAIFAFTLSWNEFLYAPIFIQDETMSQSPHR